MQMTITIDQDLLAKAKESSGIEETSALVQAALREKLHREASKRLAALGGTMPELDYIRQFRQEPEAE